LHGATFLLYNTPARSQKADCILAGGRSAGQNLTDLAHRAQYIPARGRAGGVWRDWISDRW